MGIITTDIPQNICLKVKSRSKKHLVQFEFVAVQQKLFFQVQNISKKEKMKFFSAFVLLLFCAKGDYFRHES